VKRGTTRNPKFARLRRRLGIGVAQAAGHLELLWHFTHDYARLGNVGKYSDEEIAEGAAWEGDPGRFVAALVECGWLDRCAVHRLVVHDWGDHTDEGNRKWADRNGLQFFRAVPFDSVDAGARVPPPAEDAGARVPPPAEDAGARVPPPAEDAGARVPPPGGDGTCPDRSGHIRLPNQTNTQPHQHQQRAPPCPDAAAADLIRELVNRGLSAAKAKRFVADDAALVRAVLEYHAETPGLQNPPGALRSMLEDPEDAWMFERQPDGSWRKPAGRNRRPPRPPPRPPPKPAAPEKPPISPQEARELLAAYRRKTKQEPPERFSVNQESATNDHGERPTQQPAGPPRRG
jgi:hypothetical protein